MFLVLITTASVKPPADAEFAAVSCVRRAVVSKTVRIQTEFKGFGSISERAGDGSKNQIVIFAIAIIERSWSPRRVAALASPRGLEDRYGRVLANRA